MSDRSIVQRSGRTGILGMALIWICATGIGAGIPAGNSFAAAHARSPEKSKRVETTAEEIRKGEPKPVSETRGLGQKVNINSASQDQLTSLPGVGPALAKRILDYRKENGPFKRLEDLMNVKGIGEKSFEKLKGIITIES